MPIIHDDLRRYPTDVLTPYALNARTHSPEQIAQIAASIEEFGFTNPVLIDEAGGIIAGHGRVLAAQALGMAEVPCVLLAGLTETQRRAYILADNRIALNAGWDYDLLAAELDDLRDMKFDLESLGFAREELNELIGTPNTGPPPDENAYTRKIEAPNYQPAAERPQTSELYDLTKTQELVDRIEAAHIDPDIKTFLRFAADRHTVFDFRKIADFYAHAEADVQRLMEESALVIIDFDQAIEHGFVALSEALAAQYATENRPSDVAPA